MSIYDNLVPAWQWPNRRVDLDYSVLSPEDVKELDAACVRDGWFKTGRIAKLEPVDIGFCGYSDDPKAYKRLVEGLEECRAGWRSAPGPDARIPAHAWHRHMERMNRWKPFGPLVLDDDLFIKSGIDACSELLYTSFVSVYELQRMLLNAIVRGWCWIEKVRIEMELGRRSTLVDAKNIYKTRKKLDECLFSMWVNPRGDGWCVSIDSGFLGDQGSGWVASVWPQYGGYGFSGDELWLLFAMNAALTVRLADFKRSARSASRPREVAKVCNRLTSIRNGIFMHRLLPLSGMLAAKELEGV